MSFLYLPILIEENQRNSAGHHQEKSQSKKAKTKNEKIFG